jgi:hypothetical protein
VLDCWDTGDAKKRKEKVKRQKAKVFSPISFQPLLRWFTEMEVGLDRFSLGFCVGFA